MNIPTTLRHVLYAALWFFIPIIFLLILFAKGFIPSYLHTNRFITNYPMLMLVDSSSIEAFRALVLLLISIVISFIMFWYLENMSGYRKHLIMITSYFVVCVATGSMHAALYYTGMAKYNFSNKIIDESSNAQFYRYSKAIRDIRDRIDALSSIKPSMLKYEYFLRLIP
jgi:hypothetical protein